MFFLFSFLYCLVDTLFHSCRWSRKVLTYTYTVHQVCCQFFVDNLEDTELVAVVLKEVGSSHGTHSARVTGYLLTSSP